MIKVDSAIKFLKSNKKPATFDAIYKELKSNLPDLHEEEAAIKAELWNALIGSIEIVRLEGNKFDLSKNYSLAELKRIQKLNSGSENLE